METLAAPKASQVVILPDWSKTRPLGGKGGAPIRHAPLLGPPGPPKKGGSGPKEWVQVPTRQNYENHHEHHWQHMYLLRYGTIEPKAGVHY